jgi:hypothetical protein
VALRVVQLPELTGVEEMYWERARGLENADTGRFGQLDELNQLNPEDML